MMPKKPGTRRARDARFEVTTAAADSQRNDMLIAQESIELK